MIIYEVAIEVDNEVAPEYRRWLDAHVAEILSIDGFVDATLCDRLEPPAADGRQALVMHFRLTDRAALDHYQREHAPRLREDGLQRFPARFSASRRVLSEFGHVLGARGSPTA